MVLLASGPRRRDHDAAEPPPLELHGELGRTKKTAVVG